MQARLAVTGANSAVGRAILRHARSGDLGVIACVRSSRAEAELPSLPGSGSRVARVSYEDESTLDAALAGARAAIHLPGVLIERPASTYELANVETTRALARAAAKAGLEKLVLVSAVGADARARNRYYRTKGEAEELIRSSGVPYTILRAPLILGPGTEGTAAILRHARKSRALLLNGGRTLQQPLFIGDLARAAIAAADPEMTHNRTLTLVGLDSVPERELVTRAAELLGRQLRISSLPVGPVRALAAIRTRLLGPGLSPDAIEVITQDTQEDPTAAANALGIKLTTIDEMIRCSMDQEETK